MKIFKSSHLPVSVQEAFLWHTRPGSLERQIPPWIKSAIIENQGSIHNGDKVKLSYQLCFLNFIMELQYQNYIENKQFENIQLNGPFHTWKHSRIFESDNSESSKITDTINFESAFKILTIFLSHTFVEEKIDSFFTFAHRTIANDLLLHSKYSQKKLKILVTGSSGFVGHELLPFLSSGGHRVLCLRHDTYAKEIHNAENFDAVIHLAGESIINKKWTSERKKILIESRVQFTHNLIRALKSLKNPPKIFISASGIGFFGNSDLNEIYDENAKPGVGFLSELAQQWETSTEEAKTMGMRVVNLRFGSILSSSGGLLKKIVLPYKFFLGGTFGTGKQRMPWISMTDVLGLILFTLSHHEIEGPLNAVAPQIVSAKEFSNQISEVLNRPTAIRIPELLVEGLFGERGRELFLADIAAEPEKALKFGYEFLHPNLNDALFHYLES